MRNKKMFALAAMISAGLLLTACSNADATRALEEKNARILELEGIVTQQSETIAELEASVSPAEGPVSRALEAASLLKEKDMEGFAALVHPEKGVRFSPYGYIDEATAQVFTPDEISDIMTSEEAKVWGAYDGSGEPIELSFSAYYDRFVYDQDFLNAPVIGNNKVMGLGNSLINIDEVYPGSSFVEFHFPGFNPTYEGIDWRSLRIVFEEYDSALYVVAVVHDEWTI